MKLTITNIMKIAEKYDSAYRGGTDRGMIDYELAEILYKVFSKGIKVDKAIKELSIKER